MILSRSTIAKNDQLNSSNENSSSRSKLLHSYNQIKTEPNIQQDISTTQEFKAFLLKNIPLNDPIWRSILPQEIIQDKHQLQQIISNNPEYFQHLIAQYLHQQYNSEPDPWKDSLQNKLKFQSSFLSHYMSICNQNKQIQSVDNLKKKQVLPFLSPQNFNKPHIDLKTSNQIFMNDKGQSPTANCKPPPKPILGFINFETVYQQNHKNFNVKQSLIQKPTYHLTTSKDIKMNYSSNYQSSFTDLNNKERTKLAKPDNLGVLPNGKFIGESTKSYEQKLERLKSLECIPTSKSLKTEEVGYYQKNWVWKNQFKTVNQRDFTTPENRLDLNKKILEKLTSEFHQERNRN